jgi:hypothetical protein
MDFIFFGWYLQAERLVAHYRIAKKFAGAKCFL